jgi:hypothetical protein
METTRSKSWTDEMLSTLGPKKVTKIGIWNVRTLYESGKIQQLETEMNEEERKTQEDLEEVSNGRGTQRRKDVEGGEEVGSRQKSLKKLRGSPLLLHRR